MSIQGEIDRLSAAKTAIASALETMGIEPPEGTTLDQYAAQLTAIAASAPWLDKSTYDPQNKAQDVFGYVDSVAEGLIEYVEFTYVSGNNPDTVSSSRTFTEVKESINSGRLVLGRYGNYFYSVVSHDNSSVTFLCVTAVNYARTIILTLTNSASATYSNQNPLLKSGGTMTGPLTLSGDPAEDLQAAPKQYVDKLGLPIVTTEGDGAAYTATVPGITALTAGASFIMIPHTVSTSTTPTLNVNSLGAKNIKRGLSSLSSSNSVGYSSSWLVAGYPLLMVYDGTLWKVVNMTKPDAVDLNGTLPVVNGGTGYNTFADSTYTAARYRASALYNTETAPTVNGVINWTYE